MVRRQQRVSSECPRCGEQLEHLQHILTCTDQSAIDLFDSLLTTLEGWLTHVNTHPTLIIFLTTGLRSWHEDPQGIELSLPAFERPLHIALQSQLAIGWYALLCGLVTKHFKEGITLKEVATHLGENPTTITKRLQRTFALSFSQYVGQMKVEHAKKLFRTTKLSNGEVAKRIGIHDSANFAKLFRKHAQLSPSQFRTQFGKTSKNKD